MLADRIDQLGPGQTARVDGLLNVLDFLHGELASGQNLWRSVSDQHAAAPKRPPYHLKTVFACPLLFCDKKFLQVGLSCSNFTGSRTMRQSCAASTLYTPGFKPPKSLVSKRNVPSRCSPGLSNTASLLMRSLTVFGPPPPQEPP